MSSYRLKSFGLSDIGLTRQNNEDVCVSFPEIGFFAIADGMGGHRAGEVAAQETLKHLYQSVESIKTDDCLELIIELRNAIEKANQWVYKLSKRTESLTGMGTTLCCLIWTQNAIVYAHVGDSRIYRFRNRRLELLTEDHSLFAKWLKLGKLAEECETPFPYKNVITRAVGTGTKANPEIAVSTHEPGDLFLLCTDGLSDVLSSREFEQIINSTLSPSTEKKITTMQSEIGDLELLCKNLVEQAKIKGSSDNISILTVQSVVSHEANLPRQQRHDSTRSESFPGDASRFERSPS